MRAHKAVVRRYKLKNKCRFDRNGGAVDWSTTTETTETRVTIETITNENHATLILFSPALRLSASAFTLTQNKRLLRL